MSHLMDFDYDPREQLLPDIVDHYAIIKPNAVYAEFPRCSTSYDKGYCSITYRDLANAVNGLASWLIESIGPGCSFQPLAYIGPNDIRYTALVLGAVKAGYTVCRSPHLSVIVLNSCSAKLSDVLSFAQK